MKFYRLKLKFGSLGSYKQISAVEHRVRTGIRLEMKDHIDSSVCIYKQC